MAADVPAPIAIDLRRADSRGVHREPRQLKHAAAGAGPAERSNLPRIRARLRCSRTKEWRKKLRPASRLDLRARIGTPSHKGRTQDPCGALQVRREAVQRR